MAVKYPPPYTPPTAIIVRIIAVRGFILILTPTFAITFFHQSLKYVIGLLTLKFIKSGSTVGRTVTLTVEPVGTAGSGVGVTLPEVDMLIKYCSSLIDCQHIPSKILPQVDPSSFFPSQTWPGSKTFSYFLSQNGHFLTY